MPDTRDIVDLLKSLVPGTIIAWICVVLLFLSRRSNRSISIRDVGVEIVVLLGLVAVSSAIIYPIIRAARESGGPRPCISNVKQIELGILMYLQDADEHFPPAAQWGDAAYPYLKNREIFKCPKATSPFGYAFNKSLSLLPQKNVKDEKATVMLFEANAYSINAFGGKGLLVSEPRHNGMNVSGFVDGHAAKFKAGTKMKWNP